MILALLLSGLHLFLIIQQLFQKLHEFFNIVIRLLLDPEHAVISPELLPVLHNRKPVTDRQFRIASALQQLIIRMFVRERSPLVIQHKSHSTEAVKIIEFLMSSVYDTDGDLRISSTCSSKPLLRS